MTNLVLCSGLRQGEKFPAIYDFLRQQLAGCDLIDEVFRLLENREVKITGYCPGVNTRF